MQITDMSTVMVVTNAGDPKVASQLAALVDEPGGTLLSLRVRKVGEERGAGAEKRTYGDAEVHVLIWTGFSYRALIERSQKKLRALLDKGGLITRLGQAAYAETPEVTVEDACLAIQEVQEWFSRVLAGTAVNGEVVPGPDDLPPLWKPLEVDGVKVRGARVYNGPERPGDAKAPKPGTVYLQGVKLGEVVVTPAPNGEWVPQSHPKTVVKKLLKVQLPVGLFVQYKLDPERMSDLRVAADASAAAKAVGIPIEPEALRSLFKVAP